MSLIRRKKKDPKLIYDIYRELSYRSAEINEFQTLIKNITDKRNLSIFNIEKYEDKRFIGVTIGFDTNNMTGYEFKKCVKPYPRLGISKHILNNHPLNEYQDKLIVEIRHGVMYASSIMELSKPEERRKVFYYNTYTHGKYLCHVYDVSCNEGVEVSFYFNKKYFIGQNILKKDIFEYLSQYIKVWLQSQ